MAILERLRGRVRSRESGVVQPATEGPQHPIYSEAFLTAQEKHKSRDAQWAQLVATGPLERLSFGQDRDVSVMPTESGDYVVKKLKPTSRPHLIFGLGIPAGEIPPDTDTTGGRELLLSLNRGKEVDPEEVAEKLRLMHIMASTYLDRGDKLILPTATVVDNGQVQDRQRYIPNLEPVSIVRSQREIDIEKAEKYKLFKTLQERWKEMLKTPDFKQLPPDVRDYWKTFPPDSGHGTNAKFLGLGTVFAIDY